MPAFAVTLAGLLVWNGCMLQILGSNGTINIAGDGVVGQLTNYYFSDMAAAYGLAVVAVSPATSLACFLEQRRREAAGLPVPAARRDRAAHGAAGGRRLRAAACSTSTRACRWRW